MNHDLLIANAIEAGGMRERDNLILELVIGQKNTNAPEYKMNHQDDFRSSLKIINFDFMF